MKKEDFIVAGLGADLSGIEEDESVYAATNFAGRSEAIDILDFHIIDRIKGLLEQDSDRVELELLRERAERIETSLEKIDTGLFERVRGEIAASVRPGLFERMIYGLLDNASAVNERGYDVLDTFVNGLFSDRPLPAETKALMPDMVSFHKTPVRVVIELIRLAELGSDDVFFDIGSGLGQVVLLVKLITGASSRGIEYEPAYCAYASAMASRLRLADTEFINADARDGDYSKGTVFFLYTPFEGRLLQDMLRLLRTASRDRAIRIFTYGPCSMAVAAENWLHGVNGIPEDPYALCLFASG
jgi:SAM-dependent methyltransferase